MVSWSMEVIFFMRNWNCGIISPSMTGTRPCLPRSEVESDTINPLAVLLIPQRG